jgi:hypothetical protein
MPHGIAIIPLMTYIKVRRYIDARESMNTKFLDIELIALEYLYNED